MDLTKINVNAHVANESSTNLATIAAMGDPALASIGEGTDNFSNSATAAESMRIKPILNAEVGAMQEAIDGQNLQDPEVIEKVNAKLTHYTIINVHAR